MGWSYWNATYKATWLQDYLTVRVTHLGHLHFIITFREEHFACIYVFIYMYLNDLTYYAVNSTRSVFAGAWFDTQTIFVHVEYLWRERSGTLIRWYAHYGSVQGTNILNIFPNAEIIKREARNFKIWCQEVNFSWGHRFLGTYLMYLGLRYKEIASSRGWRQVN